ncbi:NAD(+) diphosphatase [Oryzomonas japonica]|uniref:NAD(+) diphosphatase n=1 Tax=Oryzomonas japonica TaxID=2603858 RepID=A0A7J4ZSH8_9BACT|nr:NAD(+) diphosphatase [Oryzomonas japonica]KAB0666227.1 NAD(+) diphosphatase [Oryzomonas japonica]
MMFPEQIHLPFNFAIIREYFLLCYPAPHEPAEEGYWAIMQGNSILVARDENGLSLPQGGLPGWLQPKAPPIFIGQWHGKPLRAFVVASDLPLQAPFEAEAFNAAEQRLDMATLSVGGLAKQILHWDQQSRHCSRCGAPTEPMTGNWGKRCTGCGTEHFPHIHPCAIVLVRRGDHLLLTRKAEWPAGRYSLVAGFVDFGESLEECAIREVREETGIGIENVRYVGSQNWPFPAQLMAGFVADYADGEITVDLSELEDARWFPLDALPSLPPRRSIARWILDNFKTPTSCPI